MRSPLYPFGNGGAGFYKGGSFAIEESVATRCLAAGRIVPGSVFGLARITRVRLCKTSAPTCLARQTMERQTTPRNGS